MGKHPDCKEELSMDDVSRLSLFMFTVVPNLPGGDGGPAKFIGMLANGLISTTGWVLGQTNTDVETDYLTLKETFNGEIAGISDFVHQIRRSAGETIKKGTNFVAKKVAAATEAEE